MSKSSNFKQFTLLEVYQTHLKTSVSRAIDKPYLRLKISLASQAIDILASQVADKPCPLSGK
jgi:hypothetical protein